MWWLAWMSCGRPPAATRWIVEGASPPPGIEAVRRLGDRIAVRATSAEESAALERWPGARPERRYRAALQEGLDFIGQPIAEAQGFTGVGATVILFDSGADPAQFGCTVAGEPGCPLREVVEIAPDDGVDDDTGHGTAMAAVVHAVAPGAELVVLDVFDTDGFAWESDLVEAWAWAQAVAVAEPDPVVVNVSIELDGGEEGHCPWGGYLYVPGWSPWEDFLYIVGAYGSSVSSCESAYTTEVGSIYPADMGRIETPTCTDETTAAGQIACFSPDPWEFGLVAPAVMDTTGGDRLVGNSVASAFTAGAFAVLSELDLERPSDLDTHFWFPELLTPGPLPSTRLDLPVSLRSCVNSLNEVWLDYVGNTLSTLYLGADARCEWSLSIDADWATVEPATGTGTASPVVIGTTNTTGAVRTANLSSPNFLYEVVVQQDKGPGGTIRVRPPPAPFFAFATRDVTVDLSSPYGTEVCLSGSSAACTSFVPLQPSLPAQISGGAGWQSLYATFRDPAGVTGDPARTSVYYDPYAPGDRPVTVTGVDADEVDLAFGAGDVYSGVLDYAVTRAVSPTVPACGTTFVAGTTRRESGLVSGTTYTWRVCARDKAGNVSTGATASFTARADYQAPVGTLDLPAGSRSSTVTAAPSASDDTGVTEMCLSNSTSCTSWLPYATSLSWNVGGTGARTVSAWFRDAAGNVGGPVSDTTVVDTTPPSGGALAATPGDAFVDLAWSGITETGSGIAEYRLARATGTSAPSNCTNAVWTGTAAAARASGLINGTTYAFRLCAVDVAGNTASGLVATSRPAPEFTGPTDLALAVDGGATWTRSTSVTATLGATDPSGVGKACLSTTSSSCSSWFAFTPSKATSLGGSGADRTLHAWFEDVWGNRSGPVSDTIRYDGVAPTNPVVTVVPGQGRLDLSWVQGTDATSGIVETLIVSSTGSSAPSNCNGTPAWSGAGTTASLEGLVDGRTVQLRVCHRDAAGNLSTGAVTSGRPAPEFDPPTDGVVTLNAGAEWTKSTSVTASLSAVDPSGVGRVCLSGTTTCTSWATMAPEKSVTLGGSGTDRTVRAWFEDTWGNVSGPVSDTIRYDATAPTNGSVTAVGGDGQVTLSWTGFSDTTSGVVSYRVAQAAGTTAPSNCTTAVHIGTDPGVTLAGLTNGVTVAFRVCAEDAAGNRSTGVTTTARPAPEYDPPTGGTVEVEAGVAWTGDAMVDVALAASDASGVSRACLSTGTTCTAWFPMAATKVFTLTGSSGPRTVSAWFEDAWGNVSAPVGDGIGLDTTSPVNGTVTAAAGGGSVTLTWSGFSDAHSGLVSYQTVSQAGNTAPSSCATGTRIYDGPATTTTVTGLAPGAAVSFRVCAVDAVGRVSSGARVTATP